MRFWQAVLLAVVLHLTADYCDPSAPGVFFFDTESFVVDSLESRVAPRPVLRAETSQLPPSIPDTVAPMRHSPTTVRAQARVRRLVYPPRAQIAVASEAPPAAPGGSADH